MRNARAALLAATALAFFAGCAAPSGQAPRSRLANEAEPAPADDALGAPPWIWHITLRGGGDVDVGGVDVRLCFRDAPPGHVGPESLAALPLLLDVPRLTDAGGHPGPALAVDDAGIVTAGLPPGSCVAFSVDLEQAARRLQRIDLALQVGRGVLASPDVWLWRPRPWPAGSDGILIVHVAEDADGADVVVPLPPAGARAYRVPGSTFALQCYAAFGHLRRSEFARAGARFDVVRVAEGGVDDATLRAWLEVAADDVAGALGRFPVADVVVFAVPVPGGRPVHGGFLGRGGGRASVVVLLGRGPFEHRDDPELVDDDGRWVLTHELAHALLPPVARGDGWLNEGLTTWHQEWLPALAGRRSHDVARAQIAVGLRTGRARALEDGVTLARACAEMDARATYQHCYWGGAGLAALLADEVGEQGVRALVEALHARGRFDGAPRSALELLADVASHAGHDDARRAARRLLALWARFGDAGFPDVAALVDRRGSPPAGGSG